MWNINTTEDLIEASKEKWPNIEIDYSLTNFYTPSRPTTFICPKGHEMWQNPTTHLMRKGETFCRDCERETLAKERKEKCIKRYGNRLDFSKTDFKDSNKLTDVSCNIHHIDFKSRICDLMKGKICCVGCNPRLRVGVGLYGLEDIKKSFVQEATKVHGNFYDYSKIEKVTKLSSPKLPIVCPTHGEFMMTGQRHINGHICPECKRKNTLFERMTKLNGHKFIYHPEDFDESYNKIKVTCRCNKHTYYQGVGVHTSAVKEAGCFYCGAHGGLNEYTFLEDIKKRYPNCDIIGQGRPVWLGLQRFDVYFKDYNIAVEYQGSQHFNLIESWGGQKQLDLIQSNDKRKYDLCKSNNCRILYFTYDVYDATSDFEHPIYTTLKDLFSVIDNYIINNFCNQCVYIPPVITHKAKCTPTPFTIKRI